MKNLSDLAEKLNQENSTFPFFNCYFSSHLCDSVTIKASLHEKENWINKIFHNSPYVIICIMPKHGQRETEGGKYVAELVSWGFRREETKPMRKKTGTLGQVKSHLEKFFATLPVD